MTLALALEWADMGCRVLPVNGQTKRPLVKAWQEVCTTDHATIVAWWQRYPSARVGVATGGEGGIDVLDFDVSGGKPGLAQLERLIEDGVIETGTFRVVGTPSGGRHLWFAGTDQRNKQNDKAVPGVDFRGVGGMVLVPGNPGYRWVAGSGLPFAKLARVDWDKVVHVLAPESARQPDPVPARLPALAAPPKLGSLTAPLQFDNEVGEESPLDWFCSNNDINQMLRVQGWQYAYEHGGRQYWIRPGKDPKDGVSGNVYVNPNDGRQTFVNFSTSVDLPTDKGMSAAQLYANLEHRGNMREAASQIRRRLMPQRALVVSPVASQPAPGTDAPPATPRAPAGPPGADLVPAAEAGTPEPVRGFWNRRPELREVYWQAQVSDTSPWAVLGTILAEVAGRVGPHVRIPPKGGVGAAASLNILVAISGDSGEGKGVSGQVGRGFMGHPRPKHHKPGTGQGIAAMFTTQTKEGPVQENDSVVLNSTEITQLGAHMDQRGATITSTLLEVYMGEELGEHYANKELRRPVREGAYRLALVTGVQPDNASILFDHAASGLPQRFVWMPAYWDDAVLPEGSLVPPAPGYEPAPWRAWSEVLPGTLDDTLDAVEWSPSDAGLQAPGGGKKKAEPEAIAAPVKDEILVTYAPGVADTIQKEQRRRRNEIKRKKALGETAADPDSHLLLTRIKVGTLLAVWLNGRAHLDEEMWELASWVIWVSNDTRIKAQGRIRDKANEKANARINARVTEKAVMDQEDDRKYGAAHLQACLRVEHVIRTAGDWVGLRLINQKLASKEKREYKQSGVELADVLADLVATGKLETREADRSGNTISEWNAK